jgi:hypothetical protein
MVEKSSKIIVEESKDGKDKKDATLELVRHIYDPEPEKLAGMTRLPLDQVRPCSFARVFVEDMIEQCKLAVESQKLYSDNWKLWHSEVREINGIKRIPPDPDYKPIKKKKSYFNGQIVVDMSIFENVDAKRRFFSEDYKAEVIDTENDPRFEIPEMKDSIVFKWLNQYYLHRRSTTPDFSMGAIELASRQLESKPAEEDTGWDKIIKQ